MFPVMTFNTFMTDVPIVWKPVNYCDMKINWLVSIGNIGLEWGNLFHPTDFYYKRPEVLQVKVTENTSRIKLVYDIGQPSFQSQWSLVF